MMTLLWHSKTLANIEIRASVHEGSLKIGWNLIKLIENITIALTRGTDCAVDAVIIVTTGGGDGGWCRLRPFRFRDYGWCAKIFLFLLLLLLLLWLGNA